MLADFRMCRAARCYHPAGVARQMRRCGFSIEDLLELRPAAGATTTYPFVTLEWAEQWPCEEAWKARKCASTSG